jgi:uncharacterized damage-inducible protein DinB
MPLTKNPSTVMAWLLERMFARQPGWEHPTLLTLIEDLTAEQALWRPSPGRRCIWELVRHMLHWQMAVAARLQGKPMPDVDTPWPALPASHDKLELEGLWANDVARAKQTREELVNGVTALDPEEPHPHPDLAALPHWIAALGVQVHDSYHLGQVAMLRGLQGLPPRD